MKVVVLNEAGYDEAMLGLSRSYNKPLYDMPNVAEKLYRKDGGHNKFLESIVVWLDITAPRYWWQQIDTYRAPQDGEDGFQPTGITKQSESTMHTLLQRELSQDDFEVGIPSDLLFIVNTIIAQKDWYLAKRVLPESFLQSRVVCTNYKALRNIIKQRCTHKLPEWRQFIAQLLDQLEYQEFLEDLKPIEVNP